MSVRKKGKQTKLIELHIPGCATMDWVCREGYVFREWGRISRASQVINMPSGPTPLLAIAQSAFTLNKLIHLLPCFPYHHKRHLLFCTTFCLQACVKSFGLMPQRRPPFPLQTIIYVFRKPVLWKLVEH